VAGEASGSGAVDPPASQPAKPAQSGRWVDFDDLGEGIDHLVDASF
jgi:hypothetical protein